MLSAVVITRNEERTLEKCLESLNFCDELIIVDSNSTDATQHIANKFGAKIFYREMDSFSNQRNFGLSKTSGDWVLFLDADEVVNDELKDSILKNTKNSEYDGFWLKREDFFLGRKMKHGDLGNVWLARVVKKNKGLWKGDVHEKLNIHGFVGRTKGHIDHSSHENITEFIEKINLYSTLRAKELSGKGETTSLISIVLFPTLKFINLYFLKFGFLDGIYGFVHAVLMSFYSFLVRGKLYQIKNER